MAEDTWFDDLRQQWRPDRVQLLLVGESAPDSGKTPEERRYFYAPTITRADNLFRGVVAALYGATVKSGDARAPWLEQLKADGVWLVDLVPFPVNFLAAGERQSSLRRFANQRAEEIRALEPDGIIICHSPTFALLAPLLEANGSHLLHKDRIPFPLGNHRAEFVAKVRVALGIALVP